MKDLLDLRIYALEERVAFETLRNLKLESMKHDLVMFIHELCDPSCPDDYKMVIMNEIKDWI